MKKKRKRRNSLGNRIYRGIYKVMAISSELMARVGYESNSVVYKEIVKESGI